MRAIDVLCPPGSPLLHLATASRSAPVLQVRAPRFWWHGSGERGRLHTAPARPPACNTLQPAARALAQRTITRRSELPSNATITEHPQVLGAWGCQQGYAWSVAAPAGPSALTPLHLVAAARDGPLLIALFGKPMAWRLSSWWGDAPACSVQNM